MEMVFEDMEVDESAQILGLLRKKNYDPEEPDPAKRQKIYAFLARKGFSYDAINSATVSYTHLDVYKRQVRNVGYMIE